MTISKSDVLWSYAAQFFNVATGIIVLPAILRLLNTDEIAFYYIILNIGTLVNLFDFGFSAQFSRNFAYVFSGAQELRKEGLSEKVGGQINYRLLKTLINTASTVYRIIALIVITIMLTLGTLYVKKVTNNYSLISNALYIWILYTLSVFFNMYFMYLNQMVMGRGYIKRNQQAIVSSRLVYLLLAFLFLKLNFGLFSIVIANLVSPFVSRAILIFSFYDKEIKKELSKVSFTKLEKRECFNNIWYNAKKVGVAALGAFGIQKSSMFFAGLFLTSAQIASFGVLQQFIGVAIALSVTLFNAYTPKIAGYFVGRNKSQLKFDFELCLGAFYCIYLFLVTGIAILGPAILTIIGANAVLPTLLFMILYFVVQLLEQNHSLFATIIALNNKIPYVKPSLISGGGIVIGLFLSLKFSKIGIWSLILVPGIIQLLYNNWKWPYVVCRDYLHSRFFSILINSIIVFLRFLYEKLYQFIRK